MVSACCEQQQKILSWEVLALGGMDGHSPPLFSHVALDSSFQVRVPSVPVFCWCAVQIGITQCMCAANRVLLSYSSTSRVEILPLLYLNVPVHVWAGMHLLVPIPFRLQCPSLSSTFNSTFALPIPRAAACLNGRAACIRELQKLSTSWAVKLCCFKVTLTWVLQQTCTASAAAVSHEGAAVKY